MLTSCVTPRFFPMISVSSLPSGESVYLVSFLYEVAIGTRTVHTLVRGKIYASLRTSYNVDVSKRIISIVFTPQPFL